MEIRRTTIAAIAIACTAAGAGVTWMMGSGGQPPATVTAAADVPLAAPVEAAPLAAPGTAPDTAPVETAPVAAAPAPPPDAEVRERAPVVEAPAVVPAVSEIRGLPVGGPPEIRPDALGVEPLRIEFDELIVGADSVIGLRLETSVSSTTAEVEDPVEAVVSRDVLVGGRVAVPAGTRAAGSVTAVERGGRLRDPARLRVRFSELTLPDGTRVEIDSDPIYREGDGQGDETAATIGGGAIGGAIIGGILGGARGAIIGGTAGAGAGTAAAMATGPDPAVLQAGTPVTIRLLRPFAVVVKR